MNGYGEPISGVLRNRSLSYFDSLSGVKSRLDGTRGGAEQPTRLGRISVEFRDNYHWVRRVLFHRAVLFEFRPSSLLFASSSPSAMSRTIISDEQATLTYVVSQAGPSFLYTYLPADLSLTFPPVEPIQLSGSGMSKTQRRPSPNPNRSLSAYTFRPTHSSLGSADAACSSFPSPIFHRVDTELAETEEIRDNGTNS